MTELAKIRTVMDTGTLPPSRELHVHFLPDHANRLLPLALQLESTILESQNLLSSRFRYIDPVAARYIGKQEHNAAMRNITDIRHRIQMEAYFILQEHRIICPRPVRLQDYMEETRQRHGLRKWRKR